MKRFEKEYKIGDNKQDAIKRGLMLYISDVKCSKNENHKVRYVSCNVCYECLCNKRSDNNYNQVDPELIKQINIRRKLEEMRDLNIEDDLDFEDEV